MGAVSKVDVEQRRVLGGRVRAWGLLGGPWDLVTTYNWAYNPTYNPPKWA